MYKKTFGCENIIFLLTKYRRLIQMKCKCVDKSLPITVYPHLQSDPSQIKRRQSLIMFNFGNTKKTVTKQSDGTTNSCWLNILSRLSKNTNLMYYQNKHCKILN